MSHTKHRSASVLQGYVDNSMQQKTNISKALAVDNKNTCGVKSSHNNNLSDNVIKKRETNVSHSPGIKDYFN